MLQNKRIKTTYINRDEIFQKNSRVHPLRLQREKDILVELKVEPVDEELRRYKSNWLRHVTRMNNIRMTKIMLNYRLSGQRRLGRSFKRILDGPKQVYQGIIVNDDDNDDDDNDSSLLARHVVSTGFEGIVVSSSGSSRHCDLSKRLCQSINRYHLPPYNIRTYCSPSAQLTLALFFSHRSRAPSRTDIHAPDGIRTRNPSKRAATDPCLRRRGQLESSLNTCIYTRIIKF